jgi:general secretion pathway protein H
MLSRHRAHTRGLTLVEVLIVVTLIAVLSGAVVFGSGMMQSSRLRAAATLVMTSVRFAATHANSTGHPVRVVFDLENQSILLEEAQGSRMLRQRDTTRTGGAAAATEAEKTARAESERILEGPSAPRAEFKPVSELGFDAEDPSKGRALESGARIAQVQTEHDEDPITSDRAYLYVWPGGRTENAVVFLKRDSADAEEGLSVVVSALTGRAKIERGRKELPAQVLEEDYEEREAP